MFTEFRQNLLRFLAADKRALFNAGSIQGRPVDPAAPADGDTLAWSATSNKYVPTAGGGGGGGGAPTTADYLVKTANAGLSAERVVTDTASVGWDWSTAGAAKAKTLWTEAEVDFGSKPVYDATLTVTDANVSTTSKVTVMPCGKAATGRTADDWAWDNIGFAALPGTGSFTLYANAVPGPVVGTHMIAYQVA